MPTEELCQRVDDDIRPPLNGFDQIRRGGGIVDDQRDTGFMGDGGHRLEIQHIILRVAQRFREDQLGVWANRRAKILRVCGVYEGGLDTQIRQCIVQQVVGTAVETGGRDDVIARAGDVQDSQRFRRLPGRRGQRGRASLQGSDALFQHVPCRVHDACVDVAEFLQPEQIGGVFRAFEHIRRGLVDRHGACAGRRVRLLPRMQGEGFKPQLLTHGVFSFGGRIGCYQRALCGQQVSEFQDMVDKTRDRVESQWRAHGQYSRVKCDTSAVSMWSSPAAVPPGLRVRLIAIPRVAHWSLHTRSPGARKCPVARSSLCLQGNRSA